ncbi:unnamed protein product, partial [Polarella glacialis]
VAVQRVTTPTPSAPTRFVQGMASPAVGPCACMLLGSLLGRRQLRRRFRRLLRPAARVQAEGLAERVHLLALDRLEGWLAELAAKPENSESNNNLKNNNSNNNSNNNDNNNDNNNKNNNDNNNITGAPPELADRIRAAAANLEQGLVERSTEARVMLLAAFCSEHVLLLGPPGTAKSQLARRLGRFVGSEAKFFERLLTRFSVPEELFGPLSLKGLERDEYVRQTAGYLPEASVAFVDEIFKANSAILNSLLSVVNERVFDNGPNRVAVPLRSLVAASNEPPESEELDALYDRLLFRLQLQPVSDEGVADLVALASSQFRGDARADSPGGDCNFPLSLADADEARLGSAGVAVSPEVVQLLRDVRRLLSAMRPPAPISDRRLGQAVRMLQVVAWTNGRAQVELADCVLLRHVLWREAGQREVLRCWLFGRLARTRGPQVAAILDGLLDRVESGSVVPADLRRELAAFRTALESDLRGVQRQQELLRSHCWLAPADAASADHAADALLDDRHAPGPRALLAEVAHLSAALDLDEAGARAGDLVAEYVRLRRGRGELRWSWSAGGPEASEATGGPQAIEDDTFMVGKHKGRHFSEVAGSDEDYCRMVKRKVAEGSFSKDTSLDRQIRAFVAFLGARTR